MNNSNKYLIVKTNIIIQKLKDNYKDQDIVTMCIEEDPGNIRIGFKQWGPDSKIILLVGNKDEPSYWINNVNFKTSVNNNGSINPDNITKEIDDLCIIINNIMHDYKNI